ncbi:MAG: PEGA domain-containing protein [Deltaproteobacteria bacterium]|nr:PEGA domain-containing protein [Deltaproteobacteria bacterium]
MLLSLVGWSAAWAGAQPQRGGDETSPPLAKVPDGGSAGAVADGPVEPPDPRAQAQALLLEGNRLAGEGNFGQALERFQAAHDLYPSVKLLMNIGTSLRHIGNNAAAARIYEQYIAHPEAEPERREELRRIVKEIDQVTGHLRIEVNEPGVQVRLDGRPLELRGTSVTARVDPGERHLVAQKDGFVTVVRTVTVPIRQQMTVELLLLEPGKSPPVVIDVTAGTTQRFVGYSVGAAGLSGLAAGAIVGLVALSNDAAAANHCRSNAPAFCDAEGEHLGDTAAAQATASTVLFVAGGGLLVAGVVIWWTAPSPEQPVEQARLSLAMVGGHGPGLLFAMPW